MNERKKHFKTYNSSNQLVFLLLFLFPLKNAFKKRNQSKETTSHLSFPESCIRSTPMRYWVRWKYLYNTCTTENN